MNDTHLHDFVEAMTILAEALDTELTDRRMKVYWQVLQAYPWPAVERALGQALRRKWFKFPQIGELIELIQGSPADHTALAEQAWRQLWKALSSAGTYRSLFCEDRVLAEAIRELWTDWPTAGSTPRPESPEGPMYQVKHKEFIAVYVRLLTHRAAFDPYLRGRVEAENSPQVLAAFGQADVVTYLPRQGEPTAVELRALMPDHPLVKLTDADERRALTAGEENTDDDR